MMGPQRRDRWARLFGALVLFAAVTVLRFAIRPEDYDGITLLYSLPLALLAMSYGARGGVAGAGVGFSLFAIWAVTKNVDVGIVGYLTRASALLVFGGLAGFVSDKQAEIGQTNTRWFEMSNDLLVEADLNGYFTRLNHQWERQLGWTLEELMARPMLEFVHADDREATAAMGGALDTRPGEVVNFENRYLAKDGSWRWLLWNSRSDGHRKYAVARDITDRKALEQERQELFDQVQAMSRTDLLTGLPNRRSWEEQVRKAIARAQRDGRPLALAMADLDHFKLFNDSRGHQAGDVVLADVAASWRRALRATDFLARYGGEEFALLLPDCPPDEALHLLDRLRAATPHEQTCSIGIAHWDRSESAEALLARADTALYQAKRIGRNRVVTSE
ncbi:MAG: diguanylate cyclase with sensor [Acidimicrobiales bacterium]|nr:diguanylate cyclase with sensor [Acidimicrobiales bacterium]